MRAARSLTLLAFAALALQACAPGMSLVTPNGPARTQFETCRFVDIIDIETGDRHRLDAEVPQTDAERHRGLQGRFPLHPDTAMLFEFDGNANPVLWMKDTPASLDIAFFDASGTALYLESGTTPYSTRFITPEEPDPIATHALELPAGRADALDLYPGLARIEISDPHPCVN